MIRKKQVKIYKLNSRNEMRALTINGGLVCFYTVDRLDNNKPHIIMADNNNEEYIFLSEVCRFIDYKLHRVFYSHDNNVNELIRRGEAYV